MAGTSVAVEIDHSRLVRVAPLERGSRGRVDLTTIASNQQRAIIRLFVTPADPAREPQLLTSLDITELSRYGRERPSIVLESRVGRAGTLRATVIVEGRVALRRRIDVSGHLEPGVRFPWAAAAAVLVLLLLAGLGGALLLRSIEPGPAPVAERAPSDPPHSARPLPEGPERQPPAAPAAPPATEQQAEAAANDETAVTAETEAVEPDDAAAIGEQQWTVYFAPDSAQLTAAAQRELERIAMRLSQYPSEIVQIEISGHCAPAGWERGRLQLSRDRADAVARFLVAAGAPQPSEVKGFSSDRPVSRESDRLYLNRRVEIAVSRAPSPELSPAASHERPADR